MHLDDFLMTFHLVNPAQPAGVAGGAFFEGLSGLLQREGLAYLEELVPYDGAGLSALFVQQTLHPALAHALGESVARRMVAAVAAKADPLG